MSESGAADLLVRPRSVLLDALVALDEHRRAVVVIGAQAIYLHTGGAAVALAEVTKDSDLALDPAHCAIGRCSRTSCGLPASSSIRGRASRVLGSTRRESRWT